MALQIIKNQTGYVNPAQAVLNTGWSISGGFASHSGCNSGTVKSLQSFGLVVGEQYVVTYTLDNYVSGGVRLFLGTNGGTNRTANGTYTETLLCTTEALMSFFSDGTLRISRLSFYNVVDSETTGTTISFHEGSNTWGAEYTMQPELFIKFQDFLMSLKNGQLWLHDDNPVRNNLHGVQGVSKIEFYINGAPTTVKLYYSVRIESNARWGSPNKGDISILPTEGKAEGMSSRLKKDNYKNYQGSYFADFLRNMDDPRFDTELKALFKGAELRGRVMKMTIQNDDTTEVTLFEVDVKTSTSQYSY